ncbi:winged helix-turn-helix domain-containing protein [Shewanella sp. YIC-542]|uniref:winged helix-turn-helix domain-containing protein n=1 Tax=Shewanella mytili TaxID=3377111 RepID=UPI00398F4C5E
MPDEQKISLQPKFIGVLCYLAHSYPRVVPRQELIEHVWQGNGYVGEKALTNAIWHLRQALKGTDGNEAIQTIRKSGYQLLLQPEFLADADTPAVSAAPTPATTARESRVIGWRWILPLLPLLLLLLWWRYEVPTAGPPAYEVITTHPGLERYPSPSPDGRYVVYRWQRQESHPDLYMKDTQQPNLAAKQLTFDAAKEGRAIWDMTGRFLYYQKNDKQDKSCRLVQMNVNTLEEKTLWRCAYFVGQEYLDIMPDNDTLAYRGVENGQQAPATYQRSILGGEHAKPKCLIDCDTKERYIAFSADGHYLVVSRRLGRFAENIYLRELATGRERQLTHGESDIVGIAWHPDGKHIIYGVQRADRRLGFLLNIHSLKRKQLEIDGLSYPAFARKVPWLYFQTRSESYQLAYLPLASALPSSPFPLLQSDYNHKYPDYSNQHEQLAYLSNESGYYEIWVSDLAGNQRQQLTKLERPLLFPKWSHDGNRIAFLCASADGQGQSLMVLDVATRQISLVYSAAQIHSRPTWTADDRGLVAAQEKDGRRELYLFPLTGEPQQLTHDGGRYGVMLADGSLVYSRGKFGLYRLAAGAKKSDVLLAGSRFKARYSWVMTASGEVYFSDTTSSYKDIKHFSPATGRIENLVRLPVPSSLTETSFSIDDKRQRLIFSNSSKYQSDIKRLQHIALN